MEKILAILFGSCFFLYILWYFVISWFFPNKVMDLYTKAKKKDKEIFPFLPDAFLDFIFLGGNKILSIWMARIGSSIAIVIVTLFIYAAFMSNK
ncbi:MAG: hypothetical protein VB013_04505 [Anaerolineaceae bacterium]|nr:hypothetical protein [Anaerolineaceae bacterium]